MKGGGLCALLRDSEGIRAILPRCLLLPNVPLVWEVEEGGRWQRCPNRWCSD